MVKAKFLPAIKLAELLTDEVALILRSRLAEIFPRLIKSIALIIKSLALTLTKTDSLLKFPEVISRLISLALTNCPRFLILLKAVRLISLNESLVFEIPLWIIAPLREVISIFPTSEAIFL